ncbi:MAG TPA: PHB depolymerase family esterase [Gemmatales bacterium]|nr:PHB depolymerase family esterase [Gemmatales bacterium]
MSRPHARPGGSHPWRRARWLALLICPWLLGSLAQADFVFFTDGFTLEGRVQKEGKYIYDPTNQEIWVPESGYVVDDGARRIFFSHRLVAEAQMTPEGTEQPEIFQLKQPVVHYPGAPPIRGVALARVSAWDKTGKRNTELQVTTGMLKVDQYVTRVTPSFVRVETKSYYWHHPLRPQEFEPAALLAILRHHLNPKDEADKTADAHGRLFRYCVQVGWYEEARKELTALLELRPDLAEQLLPRAADLDRLQARRFDADLSRALAAGQHARVQQLLAEAPQEHAPETLLARWRQLRSKYRVQTAQCEQIRQWLAQARREAKDTEFVGRLQDVWEEIEHGLNFDTLDRLEVFHTLAGQAQRLREQGEAPDQGPEPLLALAATGWMLGGRAAEADTGFALKVHQGRGFLKRYLLEENGSRRATNRAQYEGSGGLGVDEMAQLIEHFPPPRAETLPFAADGESVTAATERWPAGVRYRLYLPPEYHHGRAYPLLVLLPGLTPLSAEDQAPWLAEAARYGFLVAVPTWAEPNQKQYGYDRREHEAVLETIRDVRRRFQVDSERVALAGSDVAGTMVYDVALSHPDLFAAAIVCCARVGKYSRILQNNAQYLPFYIIGGERDFDRPKETRQVFNHWLSRGFPSVYVEYTGRGLESYATELPTAFDWLDRKRRAKGLPELGRADITGFNRFGQEFRVFRNEDNRFYWITSDDVSAKPETPALLTAKQVSGNSLVVNADRMGQVSVWLHSSMVDFQQPVSIRINPGRPFSPVFNNKVTPSLEVMLEDYWHRGDQRNLFMARVDFNLRR